ncbi:MAG: MMPL family transporter [Planctomycetes bacterium]|nr:MMPL family transporter [Planctomycetota bacterium]
MRRSLFHRSLSGLVRYRFVVLAVAAIVALIAWPIGNRLSFDRSIENMFSPSDPLLPPYRKLKRVFGGDKVVLAAYVDPQLTTPEGYRRVEQLTGQLQKVPGVSAVLSISSTPLKEKIFADTPASRRLLEMFTGLTIGADRQTAAVVCVLASTGTDAERLSTVEVIRGVVLRHDAHGVLAGEPVMLADGFRFIDEDGRRLAWSSLGLMSLTILFLFRSLRWVLIPLLVIQWTLVVTEAVLVLSSLRLSMVSSMLSAIVTVVGVATVVHIIVRFRDARTAGLGPRRAMLLTLRELAIPVFLSCATDAVGFGSLMLTDVGPVYDFGLMMAIGSLVVIAATAALVPSLGLWGRWDADPRRTWGEKGLDHSLVRLVDTLLARPRVVGLIALVLCVAAMLGAFRLQVETDFTKNFRAGSPIVQSYDLVETRLGGAGVWDAIVPAPAQLDDAYLDRLRRLSSRLQEQVVVVNESGQTEQGLTKVLTIADPLSAMKLSELIEVIEPEELLRGANVPPALAKTASLLGLKAVLRNTPSDVLDNIMLSIPVPRRIELLRQVNPGLIDSLTSVDPLERHQRYARVMLRARERQGANQKQQIIAQTRQIVAEEFPSSLLQASGGRKPLVSAVSSPHIATSLPPGEVTGFYVLLTSLIDSLVKDQWTTFGAATLGIGLMMLVSFRSLRLTLIALVPNALPILMVTGLLGWAGLRINMGAAMIAAVSMGLSIDSSIHYLTSFLRARQRGLSTAEAIHAVHQTVGRAMIFSTLALVIGFTVLCTSQFVPTIYFGVLVSLAMLGGLAGNLVVLPLLLAWTEKKS